MKTEASKSSYQLGQTLVGTLQVVASLGPKLSVGLILIISAALKLASILPLLSNELDVGICLWLAVALFEIGFSLAYILTQSPSFLLALLGATVVFCAICVSVTQTITDFHCGCFGDLDVSPAKHLAITIVLAASFFFAEWQKRSTSVINLIPFLLAIPLGLCAGMVIVRFVPPAISLVQESADLPRVGHQWEAINDVFDTAPQTKHGTWTLVVIRPGCRRCEAVISSLRNKPADSAEKNIVLVAGDSIPSTVRQLTGAVLFHAPFLAKEPLRTPCVVKLQDGIVVETVGCF